MGKCIDTRMGDRLYAYEAGLLDETQREAFELHLLECKFCNDRAQAFKQEARLIREDAEIKAVVAQLDTGSITPAWYRTRVARTAVAVAVVVVLLLIKPWQLEFRPTQVAIASENRLVVFHFENLIDPDDPERLGAITANLIVADVSGFPTLQVVSDQRLSDVLRRLGQETPGPVSGELATRAARETGAQWILSGCVVQIDPALALTAQLAEAASGDVLAAYRLEAGQDQTVFSLVDSLTALVRIDLGLPSGSQGYADLPVAEVTTNSAEAYRYYLEGLEAYSKYFTTEAVASFRKAVEIDSTFAMAYYHLARLYNREYALSAIRFATRATPKEQLYIRSLEAAYNHDIPGSIAVLEAIVERYPDEKEAWYLLSRYASGQSRYEDAVRFCRQAIDLDPFYKLAYNRLAYLYPLLGKPDSAIGAINNYIDLAPDEPNPYDTRGDIYADIGRLDDAIESYQRAVRIKRDFSSYNSLGKLGELYIYQGHDRAAEALFREVVETGQKAARSRARTRLALIPLHRGRLAEGMRLLDDGIAADRLEQATSGSHGDRALKHYLKAHVYEATEDFDSARQHMYLTIKTHNEAFPDDRYTYRYLLAQILAEAGDVDSALLVAEDMREYLEEHQVDLTYYWYAQGCIALSEGRVEKAIADLEKATGLSDSYLARHMLSRSLIEAGRFQEAASILAVESARYGQFRRHFPIWSALDHYYLAIALEEQGKVDQATEQYHRFLDLWSEADPGLKVVNDAQSRLRRLTDQP